LTTFTAAAADTKTPNEWRNEFGKLASGMSRRDAEREIARVRNVKSTHDLWAMDVSPLVAYRLDSATILLVTYQPGAPAPRTNEGHGPPPRDGELVAYQILMLR
jgi:hypothetical protein